MRFRFLVVLATTLLLLGSGVASQNGPAAVAQIQPTDSWAATQLTQRLTGVLHFSDRMGTAQIARLAEPLALDPGHASGAYRAGDLAYWAEEQVMVVFLFDTTAGPDKGLVPLGRVLSGLEAFADCNRTCPVQLTVSGHK